MSPVLNGSTALQRFERSNAVKIRNGINVRFLLGTATHTYATVTHNM